MREIRTYGLNGRLLGRASRTALWGRPDNQLLAEQLYGRVFMERLRRDRKEAKAAARSPALPPPEMPSRACPGTPGTSRQQRLL